MGMRLSLKLLLPLAQCLAWTPEALQSVTGLLHLCSPNFYPSSPDNMSVTLSGLL